MALARTPGEGRFAFGVEWLDPHAGMYRNLNMMFFEADGSVELFDVKARRNFLKRCVPAESFTARDCTVGATVTVRARGPVCVHAPGGHCASTGGWGAASGRGA